MSMIAFLGSGNMATAFAEGLLAKNAVTQSALRCFSASGKSAAALAEKTGILQTRSLVELLAGADTLVVAFKPQHLATADPALANLTDGKLVLSVLAGKKISSLQRIFPQARNIVRTMPNTPGQIGAGITGWCVTAPLSATATIANTGNTIASTFSF